VVVLDEHVNLLNVSTNDPPNFDYALFEGQGLDSVKLRPLPPGIINHEPYIVDKGYLSDCCRFVILMLSMPPLNGVENEFDYFDMEIEFNYCESGLSNGASPTIIVFMDLAIWKFFYDE